MSQHAPEPETNDDLDPGANTQLFQAFVDRYEPSASKPARSGVGLVIAAVVVLLVIVAVILLVR